LHSIRNVFIRIAALRLLFVSVHVHINDNVAAIARNAEQRTCRIYRQNPDTYVETKTFRADGMQTAVNEWAAVMSPGSPFHSFAAVTGNTRSPMVTSRVGWTDIAFLQHYRIGDGESERAPLDESERTGSGDVWRAGSGKSVSPTRISHARPPGDSVLNQRAIC
jgi:hypothetical protein